MSLTRTLLTAASALAVMATLAYADETQDSLVAFNDNFNAYAADHDVESLVALYHEDAYWIAPDALPAQGRDGVPRQTITFMSENKGDLNHTIDELFISEDGKQAVMMGVTQGAVESVGFEFTGTYIYVLQRETTDAPWLVVVDMYNNHPAE